MKLSHIILSLAAVALMGSCALVPKRKVIVTNPSGAVSATGVPSQGSAFEVPAPPKTAGERPDSTTLCGGRWIIADVHGQRVMGEDDAPYIDFEAGSGRFYGSDGCNVLNGNYLLRSDGRMVFSDVISTMKYCAGDEVSPLIRQVVNDDATLYVDTRRIGHDTYLYLRDASDRVLMTLRRHNMEFLNGNWQVTSIDGQPVQGDECNIFFDISELKVHGNTGCNYFNGALYFDPRRANAIDISDMGVTRMMCPDLARETAMLVALEKSTSAIAGDNDDTVLLMDAKGKEVLTLKRLPLDPRE